MRRGIRWTGAIRAAGPDQRGFTACALNLEQLALALFAHHFFLSLGPRTMLTPAGAFA